MTLTAALEVLLEILLEVLLELPPLPIWIIREAMATYQKLRDAGS